MTKSGRSNNGHCDHVALWIYIYFSLFVYIRFDVVVVLKLKLRTLIGSKSVNITHACSASSPMRYELAYHLQLRMPTTHRNTIFFFALLKCFRAWSEYWSAKPNNSNANSSNSIDWRKKESLADLFEWVQLLHFWWVFFVVSRNPLTSSSLPSINYDKLVTSEMTQA